MLANLCLEMMNGKLSLNFTSRKKARRAKWPDQPIWQIVKNNKIIYLKNAIVKILRKI